MTVEELEQRMTAHEVMEQVQYDLALQRAAARAQDEANRKGR